MDYTKATDKITLPSSLTAKERCEMRKNNPVQYSQMYHYSHSQKNVWHRLTTDAHRRDEAPTEGTFRRNPSTYNTENGSGFASNNGLTMGPNPKNIRPVNETPVEALHPISLCSYRKKWPIDFYAAVRPQAATTNQTLCAWGYQKSDQKMNRTFQRSQRIF